MYLVFYVDIMLSSLTGSILDSMYATHVSSRHQCGSRSPLGARWWRRTMNLTMMKTNPLNTKLTFEHPLTHILCTYVYLKRCILITGCFTYILASWVCEFFLYTCTYTCTKIFLYIYIYTCTHAWRFIIKLLAYGICILFFEPMQLYSLGIVQLECRFQYMYDQPLMANAWLYVHVQYWI